MDGDVQTIGGAATMAAGGSLNSAGRGGNWEGTNVMATKSIEPVKAGERADFQEETLPINALHGSDVLRNAGVTLPITDIGDVNRETRLANDLGLNHKEVNGIVDGLCGL